MKTFRLVCAIAVIILLKRTRLVNSFPAGNDEVTDQPEVKPEEDLSETKDESTASTVVSSPSSLANETATTPPTKTDLKTAESEQNEHTISNPVDPMETPDNVAAASNVDPNVYGGLLTPEAFQQYLNQFGAPYPYSSAPYPAPIYSGFTPPPPPPIYPSPYVVETGYEGYLVPSTGTSTTTTAGDATSAKPSNTTALMNPLMVLNNLISTIMMSTLFRVLATIVSAVGMIFFSGSIMNMFCTYTPICEMSNKAVSYLKRRSSAQRMGRMIAEEMTPERVRRAAEFVRGAIRKYHELQQLMAERTDNDNESK